MSHACTQAYTLYSSTHNDMCTIYFVFMCITTIIIITCIDFACFLLALSQIYQDLLFATYSFSLWQEDKEPVFDSVKTILGMLEVSAEFAQNITFNHDKIKKALPAGHLDATTLADYLVKKVYFHFFQNFHYHRNFAHLHKH